MIMSFPEPKQVLTGPELEQVLRDRSDLMPPKEKKTPAVYYVTSQKYGIPGRDHASTLLYLQTVEANYKGQVMKHNRGEHMRWKVRNYPLPWDPKHGSRLWDGSILTNHDDFDCMEDLELIGLLVNYGTGINPVVRLTKRGHEAAAELIAERSMHKGF